MFRKKNIGLLEEIKEFSCSSLFADIPGLIFFKDQNSIYQGGNQNFLNIAGLNSVEELFGKTDYDLPWKEQTNAIRKNDSQVLQTGQVLQSEEILSTKNEVKVFITLRRPLKDKNGKILGLIATAVDITSIKTLEHQLQQDKNRIENEKNIAVSYLNNIVVCTPGNLYWKDLEGRYLGANEFFLKVAGLKSLDELLGKTDHDLPWSEQHEELRKNDLYVMQTGETTHAEETVILPGKNKKTFMAAKMPLRDIDGKVIGIVGNSLDITEQKEIEEDCKLAQEKAEMANRAKTKFLQDMRHDFITPFGGIVGMASILYERETNHEKKEQLNNIVKSAQVVLEQLNEITDFISIEDGDFSVLEKQFDLHKVIEDIENLLLPVAQAKNLKLIIKTDVPQYVIGDLLRTQRVLMNLLTNAIKFTEMGYVALKASIGKKENNHVIIKFKAEDTGIGIRKEEQDIIFEKFSRLTPSYKGTYTGKGLGLRVVRQFLDELGGEIHLTSKANKGSTFIVLIPYKLPLLGCNEKELLMEDPSEFEKNSE